MKKVFLTLLIIVSLTGLAEAQKKKKKDANVPKDTATVTNVEQPVQATNVQTPAPGTSQSRREILQRMYALGFRYYDLSVSQMALYEMIAMDLNNIALRDSLALLYYNMGKYGAAVAVASDVLGVEKNNLAMLEVRALSNENIQMYNEAISDYEKLYLLSPNAFTLYKLAGLQYSTKRREECKTNLDILLSNKEIDSLKVPVSINQVQQQEISLRAAALNLKGLLNKDLGNKAVAQQNFTEALKIEPDFKAAKANLDALNKPAAKPATK